MVAAVCGWHEHHAAAAEAIESRLHEGGRMVIAAHALIETYVVLTRLPPPHRLAPADAWAVLRASFVENGMVVAIGGQAHVTLVERLARENVRGGRSYASLIAASIGDAGATTLLTFNPRHFDPPPKGITVVEPAGR
jgi:predicted nucleic acid-binding protein